MDRHNLLSQSIISKRGSTDGSVDNDLDNKERILEGLTPELPATAKKSRFASDKIALGDQGIKIGVDPRIEKISDD